MNKLRKGKNGFRENGEQSEFSEKQKPEDIPRNNFSFSQTAQTDQTFHTLQTPEEKKIEPVTNLENEEGNNTKVFNKLSSKHNSTITQEQAGNNNAKITQEPQNLELSNWTKLIVYFKLDY